MLAISAALTSGSSTIWRNRGLIPIFWGSRGIEHKHHPQWVNLKLACGNQVNLGSSNESKLFYSWFTSFNENLKPIPVNHTNWTKWIFWRHRVWYLSQHLNLEIIKKDGKNFSGNYRRKYVFEQILLHVKIDPSNVHSIKPGYSRVPYFMIKFKSMIDTLDYQKHTLIWASLWHIKTDTRLLLVVFSMALKQEAWGPLIISEEDLTSGRWLLMETLWEWKTKAFCKTGSYI